MMLAVYYLATPLMLPSSTRLSLLLGVSLPTVVYYLCLFYSGGVLDDIEEGVGTKLLLIED